MVETRRLRLNGRRIENAHTPVRLGDIVTLIRDEQVEVVRVANLPARRGPAHEAQACYDRLSGTARNDNRKNRRLLTAESRPHSRTDVDAPEWR